jgi:hypothetical protein
MERTMQHIPLLLGRFLVKTGRLTEAQLHQAVQLQKELTLSPGMVGVLEGLLTLDDLRCVLAYQRQHGLLFRQAVTQLELLSEEQVARLAEHAQAANVPLGAVLIAQGSVSEAACQAGLQAFEHYRTSGVLRPAEPTPHEQPEQEDGDETTPAEHSGTDVYQSPWA